MAYSEEQKAEIQSVVCKHIAEGKSLTAVCALDGIPNRDTIYEWLAEDQAFSDKYARAREDQADFYADEIIDIADKAADANLARVQIDARKWKASKLQPRKYGDKLELNHSGSISTMSEEQVDARLAKLLGKAGSTAASGAQGPDRSGE